MNKIWYMNVQQSASVPETKMLLRLIYKDQLKN